MNAHQADYKNRISSQEILFLAMLSGCCGLAYEVLYLRLFSNYFGDSFVVSGIILCAVFFGIAAGAWLSHRAVGALGWIEASIGLYAIASATEFSMWGFEIAAFADRTGTTSVVLAFALGIPAVLIGTCVPVFTAYASQSADGSKNPFSRVYGVYNLGAFLSIFAIEYVLFRQLGLQIAIYAIGLLNLLIAAILLVRKVDQIRPFHNKNSVPVQTRVGAALFVASFVSGVFQLFMLKLSFSVFGPLQENFSIILASAILGVSVGAACATRSWLSFRNALGWSACLLLILLVFMPAYLNLWASLVHFELGDAGEILAKVTLLAGFPFAIFVMFGALVPLAAQAHDAGGTKVSGRLLAISSLGNGFGSMSMFLVLYQYVSLPSIGVLMTAILGLAYVFYPSKSKWSFSGMGFGGLIGLTLMYSALANWPRIELMLGYRVLMHKGQMEQLVRTYESDISYRAYDQNASLVTFSDNSSALAFNGYRSLTFGPHSRAELHEVIVGSTPILFGSNNATALVFGLGSGITGGATGRLYEATKIVEINPAILNMPQHFVAQNGDVMRRKSVVVALEDGISTLLTSEQNYDVIVNTVTSPQYYSASKLYTAEFYGIVKSRLSEGGTYSSWFDVNIDREGISIMLNTLEDNFAHCRYFLLTSAYFNVVCSDAPLIYQANASVQSRAQAAELDDLFKRYGFEQGFRDTMLALELDFSARFWDRSTDEINTLDRPAIEFVVARERDAGGTVQTLAAMIAANIQYQRQSSLGSSKWRKNCKTIGKMSRLAFEGC